MKLNEIKHVIWEVSWHSLIANFRFTKFLYRNGIVVPSIDVKKFIELSTLEYARELEIKYGLNRNGSKIEKRLNNSSI